MNASDLLEEAVRLLRASPAIDHWQHDREQIEAEELLGHVLHVEEPDPDAEVPPAARRRFRRLIERRAAGEPVAFLKGYAEFRGLRLVARPGVFVPRDSSEFLAEQAIRRLRGRGSPVAVDLATGGGAVALAVADAVPGAEVHGVDISPEAIAAARADARRLGIRARFAVGDLFSPLPRRLEGSVDAITLHPPYVARGELRWLPQEIRAYEPDHTLTDHSRDGLGLVERAVGEAPAWLRPRGWLLIEVSPDRARAVHGMLRREGFRDVRSTADRGFRVTRVLVGRW